jgi:hypothetical protein
VALLGPWCATSVEALTPWCRPKYFGAGRAWIVSIGVSRR